MGTGGPEEIDCRSMNVLWIVSDTFRQDHLGAYGKKPDIRTPALDFLASRSVRFDRHYVSAFPTMPARADFATGRWTMSFMGWEPLPDDVETLAELLSENGVHTAATVDTPFYIRRGMNYDRGFQSFRMHAGQQTSFVRVGNQSLKDQAEARDTRDDWRYESDTNVAQTAIKAMQWLERHYKEDFFLLVDVWDPHEPWEAPLYYTKLYMPDYSGEEVPAAYGYWRDVPGMTEEKVRKAHAAYCGEVTLVDTWLGNLLGMVERMGLMDNTAIIFTSDHGFYYGEHGLFGKMNLAKRPDATPEQFIQAAAPWDRSPLYEEVTLVPLLVYVPGVAPGAYGGLTSAVDLMPTVLDLMGQEIPPWVGGRSLLPTVQDRSTPGREFTITTVPFANPGDPVRSVDHVRRNLLVSPVTTITADEWALLYAPEGNSELYNLASDPQQQHNVIDDRPEVAKELHKYLVKFMKDTNLPEHLTRSRAELRL